MSKLYVVAPFESENISKKISSRNLELIKQYDGSGELILSLFDHRYKKYNSKAEVEGFLKREGIKGKYIYASPYYNNISVLRVLSNFIFSTLCFFYLLRKVKRSDVVLVNSIPPEILFFVSLLQRVFSFRLVADVRDIWPDALVSRPGVVASFFKAYCNFFYRLSISRVSRFLYVAPSFLNWINRWQGKNVLCKYAPLGYDEARWVGEGKPPPKELDLTRINLVYVGYLSDQFDLSGVIEAVIDSKEHCLHIIGGGGMEEKYRLIANDCPKIHFYGMRSPQFVSENLLFFDIGVLPLREGAAAFLPNKFFDYMAAGLPVLCSGSEDVRNVVESEGMGWSADKGFSRVLLSITKSDVSSCKANVMLKQGKYAMSTIYPEAVQFICESNSCGDS